MMTPKPPNWTPEQAKVGAAEIDLLLQNSPIYLGEFEDDDGTITIANVFPGVDRAPGGEDAKSRPRWRRRLRYFRRRRRDR